MQRREFLELLTAAAAVASVNGCASLSRSEADSLYRFNSLGQARILHMTDCHAQLNPIYFREPNVNLGVAKAAGRVPHRVGAASPARRDNGTPPDQIKCCGRNEHPPRG